MSPTRNIQSIPLERANSVRRKLPEVSGDWLLDSYVVGSDDHQLMHLFLPTTLRTLHSVSPVVFYGEKSLGKTALAITLSVRWSQFMRERPVCFLTGEKFCKLYADAVEIDDVASFRKKLRSAKMLVIDNCEPLCDKPAAQLELASTMDCLFSHGRPMILTVSSLSVTANGFSPHLTSRFSSGLSIRLSKPDKKSRSALIELLIEKVHPGLPAADLIALADDLCTENSLTLTQLSSLIQLAHQNSLPDGTLDLFLIRTLMLQLLNDRNPDISTIAKCVGRRLSVKLADLRGDSRVSHVVRARGLAIFLARKFTVLSFQQIGEYFGGRDHSTVLHSFRKISGLVSSDTELANACRIVESEILAR